MSARTPTAQRPPAGVARRRIMLGAAGVAVVSVIAGLLIYAELFGFGGPVSSGAIAPTLASGPDMAGVVYRLDPAQSVVRYAVEEIFAGQPVSTATGTTRHIAGSLRLDPANLARSEVGIIVINIEQFESDSSLRDKRIRREYLESSAYPEARFTPQDLRGLPSEALEMGRAYAFEMQGDLTIRTTNLPTTWAVSASLDDGLLTGTASTTLLMSAYGIGPINIAGFVETADEVNLIFDFVAVAEAQ